jgi:hypothetical protein
MSGGGWIAIVDNDDSALEATADLVRTLGSAAVGLASAAEFLNRGISGSGRLDHRHADVRDERSRTSCTPRRIRHPNAHHSDSCLSRGRHPYPGSGGGSWNYLEKPLEAIRLLACVRTAVGQPGETARRDLQDE